MSSWISISSVAGEERFLAKRIAQLPPRDIQSLYPVMFSLGWGYDVEGSGRLPSPEEAERIAAYESALAEACRAEDCHFVGSLTSDGFHQFVLYSKEQHAAYKVITHIPAQRSSSGSYDVWEITEVPDEEWSFAKKIPIESC